MMNPLANIAINQAIWFLCVLWGSGGVPFALALLLLGLLLSPRRTADLQLMVFMLGVGLCLDGTLQALGFFTFREAQTPIPLWLATVWAALALLPHHSLQWMKGRPLLAALFGGIGGPLAYWAGVRLGAASFTLPLLPSLAILAVLWAVLWPAVMAVARRQIGRTPPQPDPSQHSSSGRRSGTGTSGSKPSFHSRDTYSLQ